MDNKFDNVLSELLNESKNYVVFFDAIFGFLSRRSDFYTVAKSPSDTIGLPKGVAEDLVRQSYLKHKKRISFDKNIDVNEPPEVARCEEVVATTDEKPIEPPAKIPEKVEPAKRLESHNGAVYDNYAWSQTLADIDVTIKLPININTKDLAVNYTTENVRISIKSTGQIILAGALHNRIRVADAVWSVEKNLLQIHFDKREHIWWSQFLTSEPAIDLKTLDCNRPIDELSDEARAKIEQIKFDNGILKSASKEELLKKAWVADGSPFAGKPFDSNLVQFEN